jgi:hypothetical protein
MKRVAVYLRKGALLISPMSQTTDGVWIAENTCLQLDVAASVAEKGVAVQRALEQSREMVPHPKHASEWMQLTRALLESAGVRTWETFVKSTTSVDVDESDVELTFTPMRNNGPADGFVELQGNVLRVSRRSRAEAVGHALNQALALAE